MTRPEQRIVDDGGDPGVNGRPFGAEVAVESGRQQWMREPNRSVRAGDDVGREGRIERLRRDADSLRKASDAAVPIAEASASASRVGAGGP